MKHGRADYDARIQDSAGIIPAEEPVWLLRAQDAAAPETLRYWAQRTGALGSMNETVEAALKQADAMREWQEKVKYKVADPAPR